MHVDGRENPSDIKNSSLAGVRFYLASQVNFSEQNHRGEIWVIIQNQLSNKQFSTTPLVRDFVEQFRGGKTLLDALDQFSSAESLPSEQWLDLIGKLIQADILSSPDMHHDENRLQQYIDHESKASKAKWMRPWMLKIALGNPNKLLTSIFKKTTFIWTYPFFLIWVCYISYGAFEAFDNFSGLRYFWSTRFLDPTNIALALVLYPFLKFLHELGHGLAAKRWGADVLETGVLLILFVPLPYVDVSQSSFFPKKHQRMLVAGAGMMFELTVAVTALFLWLYTDNTFLQDICLNIILIGAVSSIFFNANPLLKFDGYYLLSDYLEIPNLSTRATTMCQYILYRYVFRLNAQFVASSLAEARWLLIYGILSYVYRLCVSFGIALYLGSQYFFIGVALALWLMLTQVIKPWFTGIKVLLDTAKSQSASYRVEGLLATYIAALFSIVFLIPWQFDKTFSGLLMLDGVAQVQAHANGFVSDILIDQNQLVEEGQALINLRNPNIAADIAYIEAKIGENVILENQYRSDDPAQSAYYADQISTLQQELKNLRQEQDSMTIRSPINGYFQRLSLENIEGRYINKGEILGNVVSSKNIDIVLMLTEQEKQTFESFEQAQIYTNSSGIYTYTVGDIQATPEATTHLPSPFLGTAHGGDIAVDSNDSDGLTTLKPMFMVKIRVDTADDKPLIGSRMLLKLHDSSVTLASMVIQRVSQVLRDRQIMD